MNKFVTFGEIMLRLAPEGYDRIVQSNKLDVFYGGGEANVSISLAAFGKESYYVTKLPKHEIGQSAVNELRRYGVITNYVIRGGDRIGIYFCEKGASQRPSKVIYDRAHSAIAEAKKEEFNWKEIFKSAAWFHYTGITPALSENCNEICLEAVKAAKEAGVMVSLDINYRKKLWSREKAGTVMEELMKYCDVVIANEEDIESVFGIKASGTDLTAGQINNLGYQVVAKEMFDKYHLKYVAITLRESISASDNGWSALLYDGANYYTSRKYDVHIVDRVGGGDSFAAGLIYGITSKMDGQSTIEFATAASCLKHTIEGDFNVVSLEEVETLMKGDGSGRVQR